MVDFKKALKDFRAKQQQGGKTVAKGNAKDIGTLWQTKVENMLSGEIPVTALEEMVKAAKVGKKEMIKILAFRNQSRTGKPIINLLAEPCDKYVKPEQVDPNSGIPKI